MYGYGGKSAKDGLFVDKDICGMIILEWIVRIKMGWCGVD